MQLAVLQQQRGAFAEALTSLTQARAQTSLPAIAADTFLMQAYTAQAQTLSAQGLLAEARTAYEQAIAHAPLPAWQTPLQQAYGAVTYQLIADEIARGHSTDVEALASSYLASQPDRLQALMNLGDLSVEQSALPLAASFYKQAVAYDDGCQRCYQALAETLLQLQQLDNALSLLRTASRKYPQAAWAHLLAGRAYQDRGEYRSALAEFRKAIALAPHDEDAYQALSAALAQRSVDEAAKVWQQAAEANPDAAWPYLRLAELYRRNRLEKLAQTAYRDAINHDPIAGMKAASPFLGDDELAASVPELGPFAVAGTTYEVNQELTTGWTFLGYHTHEARLAAGETTPLLLFWQAPAGDVPGSEKDGWYRLAGNKWMYRTDAARSLLTNGNFEQVPDDGAIPGFPLDIYKAPAHVHQVLEIERNGSVTRVAALKNDTRTTKSSLASPTIPLEPDTLYLQTAWVQSQARSAYVGRQWRGSSAKPNYTYAAAKLHAPTWQHVAQVAEPLPGSTGVRVWLLNAGSQATVYFDDVTLIPIPNPYNAKAKRRDALEAYLHDPAIASDNSWRAAMATAGPETRIEVTLENGWIFKGYTADESALAAGKPTPLVLYWLNPSGVVPGPPQDGWHEIDDGILWVQIIPQARSLLKNGNFEGKATLRGPAGFPNDVYDTPASVRQVHITQRAGKDTRIAVLANDESNPTSSLASDPFAIDPQHLYLQGGWVRAPEGGAFLGYRWLGPTLTAKPDYGYVARKLKTVAWQHVAGIAIPPQGSEQAQVWLLNFQNTTPVSFDDVFFVPIGRPQSGN
ncbi:MAG: hypothetical protein D6791_04560 [Chloroflexi bacterium]|nr:MAG: hypothetical protein D6791_04560 [Chloroflexota bacterium]